MTDEKDNVVIGPWGETPVENNGEWVKKKLDKALDKNNTHKIMQDKLDRIEVITEKIMIQLIHTISEYNYDITDEKFSLDIGFLSETVKGVLSRQEKLPHIIQGLLDNIMAPSPTQAEDGTDVFYSKFDAPLLAELVDMAEDIKDDNQTEIAFEPDTELEDITNWNKDDESKGSLHNMRTEKLHGKDDDEEKD
tara:strand:+ start:926 stop:1504 length:579 start_codon:yes stop_codon:yes gene_type:complete